MAIRMDGKMTAGVIREELREKTKGFVAKYGVPPLLAVVLVGENPASQIYVRNKRRACEEIGFGTTEILLPEATRQEELESVIDELNADQGVHGILVQLPLPKALDEEAVLRRISPAKDVDGFHPYNQGCLMMGKPSFVPCTPAGIMELLHRYGISAEGKSCVVIGRSNIVGKPLAALLLQENGTVTVCHSHTPSLWDVTKQADILVAAIGKAGFVGAEAVKPGAVVIDVGINRGEDGKIRGDVDFDAVDPIASYLTPVPGGVGPMTIAMLMQNTWKAACRQVGETE